jgi:hypothetical protein
MWTFPEADKESKESGWRLDYDMLEQIVDSMRSDNIETAPDMETLEAVILKLAQRGFMRTGGSVVPGHKPRGKIDVYNYKVIRSTNSTWFSIVCDVTMQRYDSVGPHMDLLKLSPDFKELAESIVNIQKMVEDYASMHFKIEEIEGEITPQNLWGDK